MPVKLLIKLMSPLLLGQGMLRAARTTLLACTAKQAAGREHICAAHHASHGCGCAGSADAAGKGGEPAPEPEQKWALLEGLLAEEGLDSCEARADAAAMDAAAARVQVSDPAVHRCLSPEHTLKGHAVTISTSKAGKAGGGKDQMHMLSEPTLWASPMTGLVHADMHACGSAALGRRAQAEVDEAEASAVPRTDDLPFARPACSAAAGAGARARVVAAAVRRRVAVRAQRPRQRLAGARPSGLRRPKVM